MAAPGTVEGMLGFAHRSLGTVMPVADLVYRDTYPLLMEDVTSAIAVGKSVINGVRCDQLACRRPGVDFQAWIAEEGQPLPYKYVVTDTETPALLIVTTVMSNWDVAPALSDASFSFVPFKGAKGIPLMQLDASGGRQRGGSGGQSGGIGNQPWLYCANSTARGTARLHTARYRRSRDARGLQGHAGGVVSTIITAAGTSTGRCFRVITWFMSRPSREVSVRLPGRFPA